jgi:hypothetical protein
MKRWIPMLGWLAAAPATAAEYRAIQLANGRIVPAEIGEITATEMVLHTPQGEVRIAPQELRSMEPMSPEEYAAVEPLKVLVIPFKGQASDDAKIGAMYVVRVLKGIPAIQALTLDDLPPSVGETTRSALATCETEFYCATRHGADAGADVIVMGEARTEAESKKLYIGAVFVNTPEARKREYIEFKDSLLTHRRALAIKTYHALFLSPPAGIELPALPEITPPVLPVEPEYIPKQSDFERMAWTPVPGITALKQGDSAGFVTALGVVGAGTAASVAWSGHASYSATQMVAMNALTGYGLTVLVNHMFLND